MQMHGLRLDSRPAALKGGDSGVPALVPGKSQSSLVYRYIAGIDKDVKMPPGAPLPAAEIETLKRWIDEGAVFPENAPAAIDEKMRRGKTHWAFQPLKPVAIPQVRQQQWVRNPIDAFILAKLEAQGWSPAPAATPQQLLRRAYFDITGLPPTLREQQSSRPLPDVIDDLLERPAYAERWARHWLDVVRYAESKVALTIERSGPRTVINVDDDGPGVPPEERERLFQPFTRVEGSRARDSGGMGLGLAIVKSVAEWHGGEARISDSPLGGARVSISW